MKNIIWVIGVLKRTVVSDWRFNNLSGSHLQSNYQGERFDWSVDRVAIGKCVMWLAVKTCAKTGYGKMNIEDGKQLIPTIQGQPRWRYQKGTNTRQPQACILQQQITFNHLTLQLALDCPRTTINKSHYQPPLPTDELMDLLHLCLTSTYFQYNGKHYKQLHGTAMGTPVSVVVAEIVMQNIGTGPRKLHWNTPSLATLRWQ